MAAMQPLHIPCPACGHVIEVPITTTLGTRSGQSVEVALMADRQAVLTHTAEHFAGRVTITWPEAQGGLVHGTTVAVTDADTGEPIVSALDLTVHVSLDGPIVAEMTMLTGLDGQPLRQGEPLPPTEDEAGWRKNTFRWRVAEMRTAE